MTCAGGGKRPRLDESSVAEQRVLDFVQHARPPPAALYRAALAFADAGGIAASGVPYPAAAVANDFALMEHAAGPQAKSARLPFNASRVATAGAAFALAQHMEINDATDGVTRDGGAHISVSIVAVLVALSDAAEKPFEAVAVLEAYAVGIEIAWRFGEALTSQEEPNFVPAGLKSAFGAVCAAARLLRLQGAVLRHALGIVEVHAPRVQTHKGLRVTEKPSMLRDTLAFGALAACNAVTLAKMGFTGAPCGLFDTTELQERLRDLGCAWMIVEPGLYVKPFPCCRWAQVPVRLAAKVMEKVQLQGFSLSDLVRVELHVASEAAALGAGLPVPVDCDIANYSLPWPVAVQLAVFPDVYGPEHTHMNFVTGASEKSQEARRIYQCVHVVARHDFASSKVRTDPSTAVELVFSSSHRLAATGSDLQAGAAVSSRDTESILNTGADDVELGLHSQADLRAKCIRFASFGVGEERAERLWDAALKLRAGGPLEGYLDAVLEPLASPAA